MKGKNYRLIDLFKLPKSVSVQPTFKWIILLTIRVQCITYSINIFIVELFHDRFHAAIC